MAQEVVIRTEAVETINVLQGKSPGTIVLTFWRRDDDISFAGPEMTGATVEDLIAAMVEACKEAGVESLDPSRAADRAPPPSPPPPPPTRRA